MAYIKKIWKDYPDTTTQIKAEDLNNIENGIEEIDETITALLHILGLDVDTFSTSSTYAVDDFVVHQYKLWRFIEPKTAGPWDATKVVEDTILVNE